MMKTNDYFILLMNPIYYSVSKSFSANGLPPIYDKKFNKFYTYGLIIQIDQKTYTSTYVDITAQSLAIIESDKNAILFVEPYDKLFYIRLDLLCHEQRIVPISKNEFAEILLSESLNSRLLARLDCAELKN